MSSREKEKVFSNVLFTKIFIFSDAAEFPSVWVGLVSVV